MPFTDPAMKRQYDRERRARVRAEFFAGKSCVRCGATSDLQLDHIDPKTKVDHKIWSWSAIRRNAEIAKCQVLCRACHKAKTVEQMSITHGFTVHRHGSSQMYNDGCHCELCRQHHTERSQDLRAKQRQQQRDWSI